MSAPYRISRPRASVALVGSVDIKKARKNSATKEKTNTKSAPKKGAKKLQGQALAQVTNSAGSKDERRPNVDINALNTFLESIGSYNPELIFGLAPDQPLYHYTDLGGLQGIVKNHDLWLTHSRYLNDEEEMTHGYRAAKDTVAEARDDKNGRNWRAYLDRVDELLQKPLLEGVYICCFCQKDNLLSQWRSYGANGTGVSIKFKPEYFSYVTGPDSPHGGMMRLWKVFYDPDQQRRILRSAIRFAFEHPLPPIPSIQEMARRAADAIEFFIPTFKNPDFIEESEWRLIFTPPPNCPVKPQFRVARGMLIPYYSLKELRGAPISPELQLPITGVCVGPSVNKSLNEMSVRMLLAQAGYTDIDVESSNTPYRG